MGKAGAKLIAAAKEAVKSARCRHEWEHVSMRVKDRRIISQIDECAKCGTRRTIFDSASVKAGDAS